MSDLPRIPATLADRDTVGGVVVPWVNIRLGDGGVDFRGQHRTRAERAIAEGRCQIDGQPLDAGRAVLFGHADQLASLLFAEPAMHPECAVYTSRACPMVAGRMTHHPTGPRLSEGHRGSACYDPACDCAGWIDTDPVGTPRTEPIPARPWWALYVSAYTAVRDQHGRLLAMTIPAHVRGVRLISTPGDGRTWQSVSVADALRDYTPPATSILKGR